MLYTTYIACSLPCCLLFYQDFKDTSVCNTQPHRLALSMLRGCFITEFQRYFCMQYTTLHHLLADVVLLFYQDFKDTFVCNTQHAVQCDSTCPCCFIRISKILLYAIHNMSCTFMPFGSVVLSGFQRYFCMQYTTWNWANNPEEKLFYQDFIDTFVCNTQHDQEQTFGKQVVLSGFQRYFCMLYTTVYLYRLHR